MSLDTFLLLDCGPWVPTISKPQLEVLPVMPMLPASTWDSPSWGRRWWHTAGETSSVPRGTRWIDIELTNINRIQTLCTDTRNIKEHVDKIWQVLDYQCTKVVPHIKAQGFFSPGKDFMIFRSDWTTGFLKTPRFFDRFHHCGCFGFPALRPCCLAHLL